MGFQNGAPTIWAESLSRLWYSRWLSEAFCKFLSKVQCHSSTITLLFQKSIVVSFSLGSFFFFFSCGTRIKPRVSCMLGKYSTTVLASFTAISQFWKKGPQLKKKKCPHQIGLWASLWCIFWLRIAKGGPSSLWAVPPLGWWSWVLKKAVWAGSDKQARNQHSSTACASAPASSFLPWGLALLSLE